MAKPFLLSIVNEQLHPKVDKIVVRIPWKQAETENVNLLSFEEKIESIALLPLVSQLARENARKLSHTSAKRRLIMKLSSRLFRSDVTLIRLRLSSCDIDDELLRMLCKGLASNRCLRQIMLHDNHITDSGLRDLSEAIINVTSLQSIWLGANRISDAGFQSLMLSLEGNNTIREINISNHWPFTSSEDSLERRMHPCSTQTGAKMFANYFSNHSTNGLTSLNLAEQRLLDMGATLLFDSLMDNSVMLVLNLSGNQLTDDCCDSLRYYLSRKGCGLECIKLSHNRITDQGCLHIAHSLRLNSNLRSLSLDHNLIENSGLQALFDVVSFNFSLSALYTFNNLADDSRAEVLVAMRAANNAISEEADNGVAILDGQVFYSLLDEFAAYSERASLAYSAFPCIEHSGRRLPSRHQLRNQTNTFNETETRRARTPLRPSSELGRITGIPFLGNSGTHPVRAFIEENSDSAQHLLYLRISTPLDNSSSSPTSLLQVPLFSNSCLIARMV